MKHKKIKIQKPLLQQKAEISPARRRVYWTIIILIPFILLGAAEWGLRKFHYGATFPLFVSIPDESSPYYGINLEVAKRYFTKLSDFPTPRKDLFLKQKPGNGYRIFILGESSAAGFPYGNNITFPRILNRRLTDAFPDRFIEVVNTSLTAINTYTQLDFMDDILEQKPDAILIYTGHNEYYGALGVCSMESAGKYRWIVKTSLLLQKTRLYQLLRNTIAYFKIKFFGNASNESSDDPSSTLMERIVKNKIIPLESDDYNTGINQFKENLSEIVKKA